MELVANAQLRRAMERALAADAYTKRIVSLVGDLARTGLDLANPLLVKREQCQRVAVLVLTANRGMCGGYNSSVLRLAQARIKELRADDTDIELYVSGKRGISFMKYHRVPVEESFDQFDHKPLFDDVSNLANRYLEEYLSGKLDRLEVVYTKFLSLSKQYATVETLLPLSEMTDEVEQESGSASQLATSYEFLPTPASILEEVVPMAFKVKLFKCFLDAAVSEQVSRMIAMKAATENADGIISNLTTTYNRARQSQITNEIIEVVSGASALE